MTSLLLLLIVVASLLVRHVEGATAFCHDTCNIALQDDCLTVLQEYDLVGDCCSLVEDTTTGKCRLLTSSTCYINRKGETGCTTYSDGSMSCVVPGVQYSSGSDAECPQSDFAITPSPSATEITTMAPTQYPEMVACFHPPCVEHGTPNNNNNNNNNNNHPPTPASNSVTSSPISSPGSGHASRSATLKPDAGLGEICPEEAASPGDLCTVVGLMCSFGEETCCGQTYPSLECECQQGYGGHHYFICYFTDACSKPACEAGGKGYGVATRGDDATLTTEDDASEGEDGTTGNGSGNGGGGDTGEQQNTISLTVNSMMNFLFFKGKGRDPKSNELSALAASTQSFFNQHFRNSDKYADQFIDLTISDIVPKSNRQGNADEFELDFKATITVLNNGKSTMTAAQASDAMSRADFKQYIGQYARATPTSVFDETFRVFFKGVSKV